MQPTSTTVSPQELSQRIGTAARAARKQTRLTQADVAEAVGVATEVYGRFERGLTRPGLLMFRKLCATLNLQPAQVLGLAQGLTALPTPPVTEANRMLWRLFQRAQALPPKKVRLLAYVAKHLARPSTPPSKRPSARQLRRGS